MMEKKKKTISYHFKNSREKSFLESKDKSESEKRGNQVVSTQI